MKRPLIFATSALLLIFLMPFACESSGNRFTSAGMKTPEQRIEALKKYYNLKTRILDADFDIFDVNLNADRSIPGPTSRDFRIVLFLDPSDADAWIDTARITSFPIDFSWAYEVSARLPARLFERGGVMMRDQAKDTIVFKDAGIVVIRILQS